MDSEMREWCIREEVKVEEKSVAIVKTAAMLKELGFDDDRIFREIPKQHPVHATIFPFEQSVIFSKKYRKDL